MFHLHWNSLDIAVRNYEVGIVRVFEYDVILVNRSKVRCI